MEDDLVKKIRSEEKIEIRILIIVVIISIVLGLLGFILYHRQRISYDSLIDSTIIGIFSSLITVVLLELIKAAGKY